jgi:hypothetical protein
MGDATCRNVPGRSLFAVRWSSHVVKRLPSRAPGHALICSANDTENVDNRRWARIEASQVAAPSSSQHLSASICG